MLSNWFCHEFGKFSFKMSDIHASQDPGQQNSNDCNVSSQETADVCNRNPDYTVPLKGKCKSNLNFFY